MISLVQSSSGEIEKEMTIETRCLFSFPQRISPPHLFSPLFLFISNTWCLQLSYSQPRFLLIAGLDDKKNRTPENLFFLKISGSF